MFPTYPLHKEPIQGNTTQAQLITPTVALPTLAAGGPVSGELYTTPRGVQVLIVLADTSGHVPVTVVPVPGDPAQVGLKLDAAVVAGVTFGVPLTGLGAGDLLIIPVLDEPATA